MLTTDLKSEGILFSRLLADEDILIGAETGAVFISESATGPRLALFPYQYRRSVK